MTIIKAVSSETHELYSPLIKFLRDVKLDPLEIKDRQLKKENGETLPSVVTKRNNRLRFIGVVF